MGKALELTGQQFGEWTVLERVDDNPKRSNSRWLCRCECGMERMVIGSKLTTGRSMSCGHGLQLAGKTFERLTVIEQVGSSSQRLSMWLCECECGNLVPIRGVSLTNGHTKSCGCLTIIDLTGKSFGRWLVLGLAGEKVGDGWLCRCKCGIIKTVDGEWLRNGESKSCGCLRKELHQLPEGEASFNVFYNRYITDAGVAGREFSLSKDQFKEITSGNCYYCGQPPSTIRGKSRKSNGHYISNGIDRIDNSKGYIINNCVSCCGPCNLAKHTRSAKQFKEWSIKLYENFGNKKD